MSKMPSIDAAGSGNWIPDTNRFGIPKPPEWFLKVLWDQDAALVVVPSRQAPKYLLARRRELSRTIDGVVSKLANGKPLSPVRYSDGELLASLKLVLVDTITSVSKNVFQASWMTSAPEILKDLRARDMWEAGGAESYLNKLHDAEQAVEDRKRATLVDNLEHRAGDAWRSYQARTGQRTRVAQANTPPRAKIVQVGTL